jgi:hypothetical protein
MFIFSWTLAPQFLFIHWLWRWPLILRVTLIRAKADRRKYCRVLIDEKVVGDNITCKGLQKYIWNCWMWCTNWCRTEQETLLIIVDTLGDFKVGVSVGVYCTKCTLSSGVNTNFEITHCLIGHFWWRELVLFHTKSPRLFADTNFWPGAASWPTLQVFLEQLGMFIHLDDCGTSWNHRAKFLKDARGASA